MKLLHTSDWHVGKSHQGRVAPRRAPARCSPRSPTSPPPSRRPRARRRRPLRDGRAAARRARRVVLRGAARPARDRRAGRRRDRRQPRQRGTLRGGAAGVRPRSASRCSAAPRAPDAGGVIEHRRAAGERRAHRAAAVLLAAVGHPHRAAHGARRAPLAAGATPSGCAASSAALRRRSPRPTRSTSSPRTAWCAAAQLGGGERAAQTFEDYWIGAAAFPRRAHYVALGHLHRTQQMPARRADLVLGLADPGRLRRGAATGKHVLVVEADAGGRRRRCAPVAGDGRGAAAHACAGTLAELEASPRRAIGDDCLRVRRATSPGAPASPTTCGRCSATGWSTCACAATGRSRTRRARPRTGARTRTTCSPSTSPSRTSTTIGSPRCSTSCSTRSRA